MSEVDARAAFRLRERGEAYRGIGQTLGVSKGQAHHLVKRGQALAQDDAHEVLRPPNRDCEPTAERAAGLLFRLEVDAQRVRQVIQNHRDVSATDILEALAAFNASHRDVEQRIEGRFGDATRPGRAARVTKRLIAQLEGLRESFARLLDIACDCDATLRPPSQKQHALSVFDRDVAELAAILNPKARAKLCPLTPMPDFDVDPEPEEPWESEPAMPLSKEERLRRDYRIYEARLRRVPVKKIAKTFKITPRQVRRIVRGWREIPHPPDQAAIRALLAEIARVEDDLTELPDVDPSDPDDLIAAVEQRMYLIRRHVALLRDAGMLTPEAYAAAQSAQSEGVMDLAVDVNQRVRATLEDRKVDPEVVEAVVDQVLEASGLGEFSKADIVHS